MDDAARSAWWLNGPSEEPTLRAMPRRFLGGRAQVSAVATVLAVVSSLSGLGCGASPGGDNAGTGGVADRANGAGGVTTTGAGGSTPGSSGGSTGAGGTITTGAGGSVTDGGSGT